MGILQATEKLMENKSKYDFLLVVIFSLTACKFTGTWSFLQVNVWYTIY